jgi:hypothetical protein
MKYLWQQMIDASDKALGAEPSGAYSAEDALIAEAHIQAVIDWLSLKPGFADSLFEFRLVGARVSACNAASPPDESPAYDQGGSHPQPSTHEKNP